MMRFVQGKYAPGLDKGGMVAYVMDGRVADAQESVREAITKRKPKLCIDTGGDLCTSSLLPHDKRVKETGHRLGSTTFTMHHLFLAVEAA
jgi:hypothetical protein